jgi:hypothetical protein
VASASITETVRALWRVIYLVGWMIDLGLIVPTATLGSSGVNRKKFLGLITTCHAFRGEQPVIRVIIAATDHIVIRSVEGFQETRCTPTAPEDDQRLFVGIKGQLGPGMAILLGDVIENAGAAEERDQGYTPEGLQKSPPARLLCRLGRGRLPAGQVGWFLKMVSCCYLRAGVDSESFGLQVGEC